MDTVCVDACSSVQDELILARGEQRSARMAFAQVHRDSLTFPTVAVNRVLARIWLVAFLLQQMVSPAARKPTSKVKCVIHAELWSFL